MESHFGVCRLELHVVFETLLTNLSNLFSEVNTIAIWTGPDTDKKGAMEILTSVLSGYRTRMGLSNPVLLSPYEGSMLLAIVSLPHGVGFTTKPTIEDIVHGRLSVIEVAYCNKYLLGLGVHDTVLIVWNNCEIYMIFAMRDKQYNDRKNYLHLATSGVCVPGFSPEADQWRTFHDLRSPKKQVVLEVCEYSSGNVFTYCQSLGVTATTRAQGNKLGRQKTKLCLGHDFAGKCYASSNASIIMRIAEGKPSIALPWTFPCITQRRRQVVTNVHSTDASFPELDRMNHDVDRSEDESPFVERKDIQEANRWVLVQSSEVVPKEIEEPKSSATEINIMVKVDDVVGRLENESPEVMVKEIEVTNQHVMDVHPEDMLKKIEEDNQLARERKKVVKEQKRMAFQSRGTQQHAGAQDVVVEATAGSETRSDPKQRNRKPKKKAKPKKLADGTSTPHTLMSKRAITEVMSRCKEDSTIRISESSPMRQTERDGESQTRKNDVSVTVRTHNSNNLETLAGHLQASLWTQKLQHSQVSICSSSCA